MPNGLRTRPIHICIMTRMGKLYELHAVSWTIARQGPEERRLPKRTCTNMYGK